MKFSNQTIFLGDSNSSNSDKADSPSTITKSIPTESTQSSNRNTTSSSSFIVEPKPTARGQSKDRTSDFATVSKPTTGTISQLGSQVSSLNISHGNKNEMITLSGVDHARNFDDDVTIETIGCITADDENRDDTINKRSEGSVDGEDDYPGNNNDDDDEDEDDDDDDDDDDCVDDDDNNDDTVDSDVDGETDGDEDEQNRAENEDPDEAGIETIPEDCDLLNVDIGDGLTDNWAEGVQFNINDPKLSKEQKTTLSLMIKCRKLIHMIKKSSIFNSYVKKQRNLSKKKRDLILRVIQKFPKLLKNFL